MAYISFKPTDYFGAKLYSGTGSTQSITGVGFQPDWTWIKGRSYSSNNVVYDTTRGVLKTIMTNNTDAQSTDSGSLTAWGSDGFTVGSAGASNSSGQTYASWNWKAGTSTGLDFSAGDITPSAYSINTTSGIGIYKYTGDGTVGGDTIAHNLGATPKLLIVKQLTDAYSYAVQHSSLANTQILNLDTTVAASSNDAFHNTYPTSTLITLGSSTYTNAVAGTKEYVMYAFAPVKGYSSFGSYTGNGNVDGTFIYTGFRPQYFIAKETNAVDPWHSWTGISSTSGANPLDKSSQPNDGSPEATGNSKDVDFLSNGVKLRTSNSEINGSGSPYIYMAWADQPIVGSDGTPGVAR
tara:strand:- start:34 stop:1086 length:1053 start_codon:yes stop_codon:yes gene_type:complete